MKKNSTVKFSIKKVVSRSPRSAFFSHVFFRLTSICLCLAVAVSAMAIPASAATELVPITLTAVDLNLIFIDNVESFLCTLEYSSGAGGIIYSLDDISTYFQFNDSNNEFGYSFAGTPDESTLPFLLLNDSFYVYMPFVFSPANGSTEFSFQIGISLPFDFYLSNGNDQENIISIFGSNVSDNTLVDGYILGTNDGLNPDFVCPYSSFERRLCSYSSDEPFLSFYNRYSQFSDFFTQGYPFSYFDNFTFDVSSGSKYNYLGFTFIYESIIIDQNPVNTCMIPFLGIKEFTVYVEKEISGSVEEYLDAIAGPPTPENQTIINNLKQKFVDIDSDLEQSAQDMEVEIPDISNKLDTLPPEVIQGNNMVSTNILTPILNIPFVSTIFTALFAFLAIKLILHGGGKE